ncbi:MAG: SusC/RagA family TonB-linked outer membrane protein [Bacteroidaceae bacterium]|nr:SusC/RagA family TonB-linked outer membrane protein [Bacteroidaceae bacterium]
MKRIISMLMLLACFCTMAQAQVKAGDIISGTVSDDIEPLMMVNVVEIDANKRIVAHGVTDINGNFSFKCVNPKDHIQISYVGYKTQNLPINKKVYKIVLQSDTQIEPVVIKGTQMTEGTGLSIPITEISTAQQTISMTEFEGLAMTSVDEALQGRIAGLDIVMNSGNLGAGTTMRLRGVSTITGNAEPLIVVNGNIWSENVSDDFDYNNATEERFAELLQVNPEDIESITVLKDAAATAIWGAHGANGVIEIKTKRGQRGKTRVSYSYRFTGTWQPEGIKILNGDDYTMFLKESYFNPEVDSRISDNTSTAYVPEINYDPNYSQYHMFNNNTDWQDVVKQFGQNHQHYVSLSGGGEKARFRVSGGYDHQIGTVIRQKLNRYTTRVALDYNVSNRITVSTNFSLSYTHNKQTYGGDLLGIAYQKMPNVAIFEEDENERPTGDFYIMQKEYTSSVLNDQLGVANPVANANLGRSSSNHLSLSPEFIMHYEILGTRGDQHRLSYQGSVTFGVNSDDSYSFAPSILQTDGWTGSNSNVANTSQSKSHSFSTRHSLTYAPHFNNEDHSMQFMIRGEYGSNNSSSQGIGRRWLPTSDITSALAGGVISSFSSGVGRGKNENFATQLHYAFRGMYVFDFTARFDKSNGNPKKWGAYYGISGRWNITGEKFMEKLKWINMLSLSLGWGRSGRPSGGATAMYSTYASSGSYMGVQGVAPQQIRLSVIRPANQDTWNLGTHFGFLNNRLTGDVQVYTNKSEQITSFPIPTSSGFSSIPAKLQGKVRNNGWEFNINANDVLKRGKFSMTFNASFSNNRNEILEMDEMVLDGLNDEFGFKNGQYLSRVQTHNPIGSIYGFRHKGVYAYSEYSEVEIPGVSGPDAPVARNADGEVILNENGRTKPMMFDFDGQHYEFKGGDAKYEDVNHDGNINELDIVYLGSSLPKLTGGFGFRIRYDKFSVNFQFNYRLGQKVLNTARMKAESMYDNNNQSRAVNWRWHNEGDIAPIPRALHNYGFNWLGSDRFMEEATFLRLNYVMFSYNFDQRYFSQFGIKSVTANINFNNVFVLTKYSGADPEHPQGGYSPASDGGRTPRAKSFTLSLNVGF